MSYVNNTKQTTMFQTTPQTHSIIKTEILVTLDGFLKVWLIIINNILDIVRRIKKKKKSLLSSMVSLIVASLLIFSASHTCLLLSSSLVSSLLFCLMLFCLLGKVTTDASLRVLFFAFLYICLKKKLIWAMAIGLICLLHFLNQFGAFGLHLKARNKQKNLNFPL